MRSLIAEQDELFDISRSSCMRKMAQNDSSTSPEVDFECLCCFMGDAACLPFVDAHPLCYLSHLNRHQSAQWTPSTPVPQNSFQNEPFLTASNGSLFRWFLGWISLLRFLPGPTAAALKTAQEPIEQE